MGSRFVVAWHLYIWKRRKLGELFLCRMQAQGCSALQVLHLNLIIVEIYILFLCAELSEDCCYSWATRIVVLSRKATICTNLTGSSFIDIQGFVEDEHALQTELSLEALALLFHDANLKGCMSSCAMARRPQQSFRPPVAIPPPRTKARNRHLGPTSKLTTHPFVCSVEDCIDLWSDRWFLRIFSWELCLHFWQANLCPQSGPSLFCTPYTCSSPYPRFVFPSLRWFWEGWRLECDI